MSIDVIHLFFYLNGIIYNFICLLTLDGHQGKLKEIKDMRRKEMTCSHEAANKTNLSGDQVFVPQQPQPVAAQLRCKLIISSKYDN